MTGVVYSASVSAITTQSKFRQAAKDVQDVQIDAKTGPAGVCALPQSFTLCWAALCPAA
jgi:hypothetical protein